LLKETEDMFKLQVGTHRLQDGRTARGYVIKGKKNTYLLEVHDDPDKKNGVYLYPAGNYVCIVDKSTSQVGMDKLVNRIYALHNDTMLASQIHTI